MDFDLEPETWNLELGVRTAHPALNPVQKVHSTRMMLGEELPNERHKLFFLLKGSNLGKKACGWYGISVILDL